MATYIQPTHHLIIHLKKGIETEGYFVSGDRSIYEDCYYRYIRSLSKNLHKRSYWRRHKKFIKNGAFLEMSDANNPHLHIALQKPEDTKEHLFDWAVRKAAIGNDWLKNDWRKFNDTEGFWETTWKSLWLEAVDKEKEMEKKIDYIYQHDGDLLTILNDCNIDQRYRHLRAVGLFNYMSKNQFGKKGEMLLDPDFEGLLVAGDFNNNKWQEKSAAEKKKKKLEKIDKFIHQQIRIAA